MTATQTEHRPTFPEEGLAREAEQERREIAAALEKREDLIWKLSGPRGRRDLRRQLCEAGFYAWRDEVDSTFNRHHGEMCKAEAVRNEALQLIWPIMKLVASRDIPFDSFQKLMMKETDK